MRKHPWEYMQTKFTKEVPLNDIHQTKLVRLSPSQFRVDFDSESQYISPVKTLHVIACSLFIFKFFFNK